mgnify:FL=1
MANIKKFRSTYDAVKSLLQEDDNRIIDKYRDDDELLVCRFWCDELKNKNIVVKSLDAIAFMMMYKKGLITSADCVTRARRKITENFPELRGKSYKKRKGNLQNSSVEQVMSV